MAPEAANQKRKRGRLTNASQEDQNASQTQLILTKRGKIAQRVDEADNVDGDEDARPRKRGKTARAEPESQPEPVQTGTRESGRKVSQKQGRGTSNNQEDADKGSSRSNKRGRNQLSQQVIQDDTPDETEVVASEEPRPKKRGRPLKEVQVRNEKEAAAEETHDENEGNSSLLRRSGRGRRSVGEWYKGSPHASAKQTTPEVPREEEGNDENPEGYSSIVRRSGRDHKSVGAWYKVGQEGENQGGRSPEEPVRRKQVREKGRPSIEGEPSVSSKDITEQKKLKRRRHPSPEEQPAEVEPTKKSQARRKNRAPPPDSTDNAETVLQEKRRRRRSEDQVPDPEQEEQDSGAEQERDHVRRGRHSSDTAVSKLKKSKRASRRDRSRSESPEPAPAPYRHLTSRTRHVSRDTINDKWTSLDSTSISSITQLLHSASRPVLLRLNNLQKHGYAQAALNAVSNRMRNKLIRGLPFPPASTATRREDELEFEHTIDGIQTLESQLDPLLHGVALLKKEKERAERELEREYKVLSELSANARAEMRERRGQLRKMHTLVPAHEGDGESMSAVGDVLPVKHAGARKTFVGLEDDELMGLAGQIGNHMESMRGNLQQVDGVALAIEKSRAALRLALLPHLDEESFEQMVLG